MNLCGSGSNTTVDLMDVLFTSDIIELSVFQLVLGQQINRAICCIFGLPLNVLVMVVILRSNQRWSPQNILWLAVISVNIVFLMEATSEIVLYYQHQRSDGSHQLLCQIFSTLLGCPYGLLLAGLTLTSCDRYLAMAHQQFYRKHATTKHAVLVCLLTFLVVTGVELFPFWTGMYTIECGLRYDWLTIVLIFHGCQSVACLCVQMRIFFFIRKCIRFLSSVDDDIHQHSPDGGSRRPSLRNRLLDIRPARTLAFGILPYCFVNFGICVSHIVRAGLQSCGMDIFVVRIFVLTCRELICLHLIYIPMVFMAQDHRCHTFIMEFFRSKKISNWIGRK